MLIIDSGNTNCKLWIGSKKLLKAYSTDFTAVEIELLKKEAGNPVLFSSVAPQKFDVMMGFLKEIDFTTFVDIGTRVRNERPLGNDVQGIGVDRILGMIGAATFLKTPVITVDCGTAVTVNFLKEKQHCAGGAIFAGYSTQLRTLTANTEGIAFKNSQGFKKAIGKTTDEALQSGILHSITGGIRSLYEGFLKETEMEKANVIITGGDGEMIFKKLQNEKFECVFKEDLIKLGIEEVFKRMNNSDVEKYTVAVNY